MPNPAPLQRAQGLLPERSSFAISAGRSERGHHTIRLFGFELASSSHTSSSARSPETPTRREECIGSGVRSNLARRRNSSPPMRPSLEHPAVPIASKSAAVTRATNPDRKLIGGRIVSAPCSFLRDPFSELRAQSSELRAQSSEPGAWSLELGAWSSEFGARSSELGAWSSEPGARSSELGPWSLELEAWSSELVARAACSIHRGGIARTLASMHRRTLFEADPSVPQPAFDEQPRPRRHDDRREPVRE